MPANRIKLLRVQSVEYLISSCGPTCHFPKDFPHDCMLEPRKKFLDGHHITHSGLKKELSELLTAWVDAFTSRGLTWPEILHQLTVSEQCIKKALYRCKRRDLIKLHRKSIQKKPYVPVPKMDYVPALALRNAGVSVTVIAAQLGVNEATVRRHLRALGYVAPPNPPRIPKPPREKKLRGAKYALLLFNSGLGGVSIDAVHYAVKHIPKPPRKKKSQPTYYASVLELRNAGVSVKEIAGTVGLAKRTVQEALKAQGYVTPQKPPKQKKKVPGSPHASRKFDYALALEMSRTGKSGREIAQHFGVHDDTVRRALRIFGVKPAPARTGRPRKAAFDLQRVAAMRGAGMSWPEIKQAFGLKHSGKMRRALREVGLYRRHAQGPYASAPVPVAACPR